MSDEPIEMEILAETENFVIWRNKEDAGYLYHVELGGITLHLTSEEWEELAVLVKGTD